MTTWGPHYDTDATMVVPKPSINSFYIMSYRSIISTFLAVSTFVWMELVHLLTKHFQTPVNKLNNVIMTFIWKFLKIIVGHMQPACLRPLFYCMIVSTWAGWTRWQTNFLQIHCVSAINKLQTFVLWFCLNAGLNRCVRIGWGMTKSDACA